MIKRIIDISEQSYLHLKHKQLLVDRDSETIASIPIEDIGVLILQHPAIVVTQAVIIACQENNVVLVFCNAQHLPYSIVLPVSDANSLHSKVLRQQVQIKKTTKKRLWKQVVQHKIMQQAETLAILEKNSNPLERMIQKVKAGDTENHEAQAAKQYWRLLMGNDFRRDKEENGINALLNYGYAIMRAMIARAIVGSGLHPALGLHHHNQYNGLCLADDLMEPFRPWVDRVVYRISTEQNEVVIDKENKKLLLSLLSTPVIWEENSMPLMVACHYLTANLKRAYSDNTVKLNYPSLERQMRL
jgi:CRISPR-associated protein Cas1